MYSMLFMNISTYRYKALRIGKTKKACFYEKIDLYVTIKKIVIIYFYMVYIYYFFSAYKNMSYYLNVRIFR